MNHELSHREKIEEAHGLWELAIVRLAAFVEAGATKELISGAVEEERDAFNYWLKKSHEALS